MEQDMDFTKVSEEDKSLILEGNDYYCEKQYKFFGSNHNRRDFARQLRCKVLVGSQNHAEDMNKVSWLQLANINAHSLNVFLAGERVDNVSIPFYCILDDDGLSYLFDFASASKNKDDSIDMIINKRKFPIYGIKATNSLSAVAQVFVDNLGRILSDEKNNTTK